MTVKDLQEALWQAYYHNELEELGMALFFQNIDGNDHPVLELTAERLFERIKDETCQ